MTTHGRSRNQTVCSPWVRDRRPVGPSSILDRRQRDVPDFVRHDSRYAESYQATIGGFKCAGAGGDGCTSYTIYASVAVAASIAALLEEDEEAP